MIKYYIFFEFIEQFLFHEIEKKTIILLSNSWYILSQKDFQTEFFQFINTFK